MYFLIKESKLPKGGPRFSSARCSILSVFVFFLFGLIAPVAQLIDGPSVTARLAKESLLLGIHGRAGMAIAVGERGHILLTNNQGKNWIQKQSPTRRTLNSVYLLDQKTIWIVGHQSTVLRSKDSGESWTKIKVLDDPETSFLDLLFVDSSRGFIVGSYGKLFSTIDGGNTWIENKQEDDPHFYQITSAANGFLWLIGEFGTVWKSNNQGKSWKSLDIEYEGTLFGAVPLIKSDSIIVHGLQGNIFRFKNGSIWEKIDSPTNAILHRGLQLKDGRVVIASGAGELLLGNGEGRLFQVEPLLEKAAVPTDFWQSEDGSLLITTDRGVFRITLDELN